MPERVLPTGTVSFLLTDIEGSTDPLQRLGDQAYGEVLARHQIVLRRAFQQEQGTEVDTQGDAFFFAFPRAGNAVAAAAAAQRGLAVERWPDGLTLRVRMGTARGEPAGDLSQLLRAAEPDPAPGHLGLRPRRRLRPDPLGHRVIVRYEPYVNALSSRLPMPLPSWLPVPGARRDNWERPRWH
ncbi:MAG: hypothetical protein HY334_08795 [Armatimonadetes bacterium]|nr:hypothetical protein [Armatimonadota bacterium]